MDSNLALREEMTGGLGSFALGEADAEAYLSRETGVGSGGIADLGAIRERMARAGRFDDDHVGHLATGELVVPAPLLEKLPELRESILSHLREMGVENPERYIVGNKLNSVNPETGMVEFGFFSSIGKAFKSIGKVLKKVAPLIITAALSTVVGPIAAGMIGSGLGTFINGGSVKDAFISAGIGGITGGLAPSIGSIAAQGLGGMAQAAVAGGDMKAILTGGAIGAAGAGLGKIASANFANTTIGKTLGLTNPKGLSSLELISEDLGTTGKFMSDITSGNVSEAFQPSATNLSDEFAKYFGTSPQAPTIPTTAAPAADSETLDVDYVNEDPKPTLDRVIDYFGDNSFTRTAAKVVNEPVKTLLTGESTLSPSEAARAQAKAYNETNSAYLAEGNTPAVAAAAATKAGTDALAAAEPGFFARNPWAITVPAVGALAFSDTLFGEEIPGEGDPNVLPGDFSPGGPSQEAIAANRLASISGNPDALKPLTFANRQTRVNPAINEDLRRRFPEMFAEAGGGVFPRRTGGIMPNEGIPGEDSVNARVMPGEFIFTTNAVRGASPDGSLRGGINNMYSVMRNLEARGRRMA